MVFRPYRYDGRMAYDAIAMGDGVSAEQVIADIFADRTVEFIHTRNVYAGCFMFAITRPVAERDRCHHSDAPDEGDERAPSTWSPTSG